MTDTEIIQIFSDKRGKINPNRTRLTWLAKNPQVKAYLENRYSVFFLIILLHCNSFLII